MQSRAVLSDEVAVGRRAGVVLLNELNLHGSAIGDRDGQVDLDALPEVVNVLERGVLDNEKGPTPRFFVQ